jgi:hypothetical protein
MMKFVDFVRHSLEGLAVSVNLASASAEASKWLARPAKRSAAKNRSSSKRNSGTTIAMVPLCFNARCTMATIDRSRSFGHDHETARFVSQRL